MLISFDPNVRLPLWDSPAKCQEAIREFLPYANIVKLSDDELEFVTGCGNEQQAAKQLFEGECRMLLVTKGGDGSAVYTRNAQAQYGVVEGSVVDTTGAGDSFAGSFLFQLVRDKVELEDMDTLTAETLTKYLKFSARYAAMTVSRKGAVMASMEEFQRTYPVD